MKVVLKYTFITVVLAYLTVPVPGSSFVLTALEIYMVIDIGKQHGFKLKIKEIGYAAAGLWALTEALKNLVSELLRLLPGLGWVANGIIAGIFVFVLGLIATRYFEKH